MDAPQPGPARSSAGPDVELVAAQPCPAAKEIQLALTPEEESLLTARRSVEATAQEAFLRGMFHLQQFSLQDFEAALEIEPEAEPVVGS